MPELAKNVNLLPWKPTFWLHFEVEDASVWVDWGLPLPNFIKIENGKAYIAWQIDGAFYTRRAVRYLNDIIARIELTLGESSTRRLPWKPDLKSADHYFPKIKRLQELQQHLKSLESGGRRYAPARADSFSDYTFWAIKLWTEDEIREQGEGLPVVYETLESWALQNFENKERSTIRAKCRSVWNWYNRRDWTLPKGRNGEMTRAERARKNSQKIAEETKRKIVNATTGMFASEYKKPSGKWNIAKLAKELNMSRNTVSKYLKKLEQTA